MNVNMNTQWFFLRRVGICVVVLTCTVSGAENDAQTNGLQTNQVDCAALINKIEDIAQTNLILAVQENNLDRIRAVQELMVSIVNVPEKNRGQWEEASPKFTRMQFQILQTLYDMRKRWTRISPLSSLTPSERDPNKELYAKPDDIEDQSLRREYEKWLVYKEKNRDKVARDGILENMFRRELVLLIRIARDPQLSSMIKEVIRDTELLEALLPQTVSGSR